MTLSALGLKYGIGQYRYPHSFQLTGAAVSGRTEEGRSVRLEFLDRTRLVIDRGDGEPVVSVYECLPVARGVFFVSLEIGALFAVIDLEAGQLVLIDVDAETHLTASLDGSATVPVRVSDEMAGTAVAWVVGDGKEVRQRFRPDGRVHQGWSPRFDRSHECEVTAFDLGRGLFVVDVAGFAGPGLHVPQGLGRLVMVQDYARMTAVGAVVATTFNDRVLLGAYGRFLEDEPAAAQNA